MKKTNKIGKGLNSWPVAVGIVVMGGAAITLVALAVFGLLLGAGDVLQTLFEIPVIYGAIIMFVILLAIVLSVPLIVSTKGWLESMNEEEDK